MFIKAQRSEWASNWDAMIDIHLKRQLQIKGGVVAILALGFVVSITIPKLAIIRLGEAGYGIYALIIGFSGILAFADLGLEPGLIRGLARPIAMGNWGEVNVRLRTIDGLVFGALAFLVAGCAALMYWSLHTLDWSALHALVVFAVATSFYIRADVRAEMLRVSGAVVGSYVFRGLYLVVYLSIVVAFYSWIRVWHGVWLLCYAQLLASCIYYLAIWSSLRRRRSRLSPSLDNTAFVGAKTDFWAEAWRVSSPERLNRMIQLVMGAVERPLLIATAGLAMVTSYDLLMRLVIFVSAVPGALNDPLLAMLAHDSVRESPDRKFPLALRLTRIASAVCAVAGLVVSLVLWGFFHVALFRVPSRIPLGVGILIAVVAAVNVQTASGSAVLVSKGIVGPLKAKLYTEVGGIIIGGVAAWWLRNGLLFIAIRYCALGLSAIGFLIAESWFLKGTHEQKKEPCCAGHQLERRAGYP